MGARGILSATSAYLDASAAVKLLHREPESAALREALDGFVNCVSSELLEVELRCVAWRLGGAVVGERVEPVLATIDLLPYTASVSARAGLRFDPPQRALDAIHLATALEIEDGKLVVVSYDGNQRNAAESAGLTWIAPN